MRERPILFSAPMVRAILAGRKTQTRRAISPHSFRAAGAPDHAQAITFDGERWQYGDNDGYHDMRPPPCRYGERGDRLWVRETWRADGYRPADTIYRADFSEAHLAEVKGLVPWRPAIHMQRARSRIALEITAVRAERLYAITIVDEIAEGVTHYRCGHPDCSGPGGEAGMHYGPRGAYFELWEQINGKGSWDENPWVWVVEFRRLCE